MYIDVISVFGCRQNNYLQAVASSWVQQEKKRVILLPEIVNKYTMLDTFRVRIGYRFNGHPSENDQ